MHCCCVAAVCSHDSCGTGLAEPLLATASSLRDAYCPRLAACGSARRTRRHRILTTTTIHRGCAHFRSALWTLCFRETAALSAPGDVSARLKAHRSPTDPKFPSRCGKHAAGRSRSARCYLIRSGDMVRVLSPYRRCSTPSVLLYSAYVCVLCIVAGVARAAPSMAPGMLGASAMVGSNCNDWPSTCPGTFPSGRQTWLMNESTIIMPCNDTGFTDPRTTAGWYVGIITTAVPAAGVSLLTHAVVWATGA